jgi:hypothetical protein
VSWTPRMSRSLRLAISAVLLLAVPGLAAADGAVAVGVPSSVKQDGYAYGRITNSPNAAEASEHALNKCRTAEGTTPAARDLCVVVMKFQDQCVALALDPQAGTPGAGWAVAPTKEAAETQALAQCVATAGPGRRDSCQISDSACDGD